MAKNVQGVLFLRNGRLYTTRDEALTAIESNKGLVGDGQFILARYGEGSDVKTLVGVKYGSGNTSADTLTIIDVEGGSTDVQELREQMENTFGTGVTTANTATAQLAALSGATFTAGTSSSADTSVEGAKAYAYDLVGTLDGGVTAETGYFVKSVSEVDGKISGTTEALPSVTDAAVAKKFVTQVSETNGEISVTRGEVTSTDKTVVLTDGSDSGIDLAVNIDGLTLQKDEHGVISVTSSALVRYEGDDDTIQISAVSQGVRTVSSPLTISATTPSEANVKEQYNLVGASGNTIGATIKIYKDSSLLSVALLHADYSDPQNPVLPTYSKTNGWTDIAETARTEANQALCFAYENVNGNIDVAAVPVGAFINEQEFASGVTWDSAAGKVKGVVDGTSEAFLTVGADGFKLAGVQTAIDNAVSGAVGTLDATVNNNANSGHVAVEIVETDGKLVSVTVTEDDIASADDIEELSAKTVTEIASSNASIAVSTATTTADDDTVKYDIITDADKIQMSGFSADNISALSGIAESDSIATAFEKTNTVITENERVTAEALTNLNGRLEEIEPIYVSGVSVNGNAVTVADHVAPISIQAATGTPTGTITDPAIIVNNNASTGAVTLGIGYIDCGTYD